jgi:ornithine decarboxylase
MSEPKGVRVTPRLRRFLEEGHQTPFVVVDLDVVAERYERLAKSLPNVAIHYAVKANPAPEILKLLVELGSSFDVASPTEIELCRQAGADPATLSYGNTIKRRDDIASAHAFGVRQYAVDCDAEVDKVAAMAPGSTVACRVLCDGDGAAWPLSRKFGCPPEHAGPILRRAASAGLGTGVVFHVGSQQRDPGAWSGAIELAAGILDELRADGIEPEVLNVGGGFPGTYEDHAPEIEAFGAAIGAELDALGDRLPARVVAEPGRYLVADAGVLQSEVLLVSHKDDPDVRWVFLDVGVFTGLVEALDESIRYVIRTPHDGGPTGPAVVAGPTCDSIDVLYERQPYDLPLALAEGDRVLLLGTGAYTTTYSTVGFNGFAPLRSHVLGKR